MVNIDKQVAFWRQGSAEDWDVARALVERGNVRHGLFFAHLALEKALKALVCAHTQELAPRLHNLLRLAELAGMELSSESLDLLAEMNVFSLEGRYPDALSAPPTIEEAREVLSRAAEVLECLNKT
jgi:HEPN domain-containing protein